METIKQWLTDSGAIMKRRSFLAAGAALLATRTGWSLDAATPRSTRFKQGVTRQIFGDLPLEDCCRLAASVGVKAFDFIFDPGDWPTLRRYSLTMSMYRLDYGGGISKGRTPEGPPGWNSIGHAEAM